MIKALFWAHKKIYGYPCRHHVRLALSQDLISDSFNWRIGMLYVCGEEVSSIAKHMEVSRDTIRHILIMLTLGVKL